MKNREIVLDNLAQVRSLLLSTLLLLDEENKDGKQFDYVNSPRLSDSFDAANRTMQKINKIDRKSTRLNSSHLGISYAVFCLDRKSVV